MLSQLLYDGPLIGNVKFLLQEPCTDLDGSEPCLQVAEGRWRLWAGATWAPSVGLKEPPLHVSQPRPELPQHILHLQG